MQIRLKMSWGQWSKGHVFADMPGGQARTLIARGLAEEIVDETDKAIISAPVDRMMRAGRRMRAKGENVL